MHTRILCVDDDPKIRQLLPPILQGNGYEVAVASTVAEALNEIAARPFDVLIADLNIGEPGDGFTVVSAMRRTHPQCVNFILTGYPALEEALQAIRNQVDRFIVKPTDVNDLLMLIEERLREHSPQQPSEAKRVAEVLRNQSCEIARRSLEAMKAHPELSALPLSDEDRISLIPSILRNLAAILDCPTNKEAVRKLAATATEQARIRFAQGYTIPLLMENVRIVGDAIADIIRENMLSIDMSTLWPDIQRLNDGGVMHVKELLKAYSMVVEKVA